MRTEGDQLSTEGRTPSGGDTAGVFTAPSTTRSGRGEIDFAVHSLKDVPTSTPRTSSSPPSRAARTSATRSSSPRGHAGGTPCSGLSGRGARSPRPARGASRSSCASGPTSTTRHDGGERRHASPPPRGGARRRARPRLRGARPPARSGCGITRRLPPRRAASAAPAQGALGDRLPRGRRPMRPAPSLARRPSRARDGRGRAEPPERAPRRLPRAGRRVAGARQGASSSGPRPLSRRPRGARGRGGRRRIGPWRRAGRWLADAPRPRRRAPRRRPPRRSGTSRLLLLRSGRPELREGGSSGDVDLLVTHEIVPLIAGIAEARAVRPDGRDARRHVADDGRHAPRRGRRERP